GINILTGQQHAFDWRGLAAAAIVAPLSKAIGSAFPANPIAGGFVSRFAGGIASGAIKAALGGKVDFEHVAADAFGNALGNAITDSLANAAQPTQALGKAQQDAEQPETVPLPQPKPYIGVAPGYVEQQPEPTAEGIGKSPAAPGNPDAAPLEGPDGPVDPDAL